MPPSTRKPTSSDKPEEAPDATERDIYDAPPAPAPEPAATPENPGQDDASPAAEDDAPEPTPGDGEEQRVRLVPSDWLVTSVEFPTGETSEKDGPVRVTVSRDVAYVVTDAEADALIAAAAGHGFALTKEPVA